MLTSIRAIHHRLSGIRIEPGIHLQPPPSADARPAALVRAKTEAAAALASECKGLAHPASVDSIPTDGNKEDVVPMAMGAATKLRRSVRNLRHVLAIELIAAAEALEYRRPLRSSVAVERAHAIVRQHVARATGDRSPAPDITRLGDAVASGAFDAITEGFIV